MVFFVCVCVFACICLCRVLLLVLDAVCGCADVDVVEVVVAAAVRWCGLRVCVLSVAFGLRTSTLTMMMLRACVCTGVRACDGWIREATTSQIGFINHTHAYRLLQTHAHKYTRAHCKHCPCHHQRHTITHRLAHTHCKHRFIVHATLSGVLSMLSVLLLATYKRYCTARLPLLVGRSHS